MELKHQEIQMKPAQLSDLQTIVKLFFEDDLGSQREHYENPLPDSYVESFR